MAISGSHTGRLPAPPSLHAAAERRGRRGSDDPIELWLCDYARLRDAEPATAAAAAAAHRRPGGGSADTRETLKARITAHYAGLVESVARRYTAGGEPLEDLVQEGYLGLLSALEGYDPTKGVKFSTYATHFIAGAARHCLRDRGKIIKEPAWLHDLSGKVTRAADALTQSLGRAPHAGEIARALDVPEETVEDVLATRVVFQVASFDAPADAGEGGGATAAAAADPEKIAADGSGRTPPPLEERIVLEGAVEKLKALEQKVLYEFYYCDLSQTEIARKFGISCNYVSHILKNSAKKLRRILGEAEVRDRGRLRVSSVVDRASGLYNSAHIEARLEEEVSRAARGGTPFAVVAATLTDLPAGGHYRDDLLSVCGATVRTNIRRVDIAGRLAPEASRETLLVLLPHTGTTGSVVVERLREVLGEVAANERTPFGVLVGLAVFPDQARTARDLLRLARENVENDCDDAALPLAA